LGRLGWLNYRSIVPALQLNRSTPAALFLVSVLSTWWLYRRFAREDRKRD